MKEKLIGTICLTLAIIIFVTTGTSYAYFTASTTSSGSIDGETADFEVSLDIEETYTATHLIPLEDSLISTAVKNNCIDKNRYQVCSLYKITLTNTGTPQILNGYIKSEEGTTYTTSNLRGQLFNSDLTSSVSTAIELSNDGTKQYFKVDGSNMTTSEVSNTPVVYYLAIWLNETHSSQIEDYNKKFVGSVTFESINGNQITSKFSA